MEEKRICFNCGCVMDENSLDWTEIDGNIYCDNCRCELFSYCEICDSWVDVDNITEVHGNWVCDDCLDRQYFRCARCGGYEHINEVHDTMDGDMCEYCFREYYIECHECGNIIHIDDSIYDDYDEEYYCGDCYDNRARAINSYNYKPEPVFYGDNKLYLGVELEIDGAGEDSESAQKILDIDGSGRIYIKHDGSLEEGFEIVSHPCTLEYHKNYMMWADICEKAVEMGYTSHNAGTCGLHVHISRKALGATEKEMDDTLANILYFMEKNWDYILKFSRRTQNQLDRWASRYGLEPSEYPDDLLKKAKNNYGRYKAVNLQNAHTIEMRLFRGTLKYNTFIATLQFCDSLVRFCKEYDTSAIMLKSWGDFVKTITDAELKHYLIDRNINGGI